MDTICIYTLKVNDKSQGISMQIKISGEVFPLLSATAEMETLNGFRRDVITMEIETTYAKAISKFIDGASL